MQGEWPPGCRGKSCICAVARECARVACVRPFVDASLSVLSLVLDRYMACGCQSPFCNKHIHHPYLRTLHEIFGVATWTTHLTHTSHTGFLLYSIVLFRLQYRPVIPPMTVRPRIINVVRVPLASTITTTISHYAVCVCALLGCHSNRSKLPECSGR